MPDLVVTRPERELRADVVSKLIKQGNYANEPTGHVTLSRRKISLSRQMASESVISWSRVVCHQSNNNEIHLGHG